MQYPYSIILISLSVFLVVQGVTYAYQIAKTPVAHGHTYTSVMTGSLMIASGVTFALYIILDSADEIQQLWPALAVPTVVLVLVGGAMAISQAFKHKNEVTKKNEIEETGGFDQE